MPASSESWPSCALVCFLLLLWPSLMLAVRVTPQDQEDGLQSTPLLLLCPPSCNCEPLSQRKAILDCRERGLSNVPLPLPNVTLKLYLDGNALQVLDNMGPVPDLEVLTLNRNALSVLPEDSFRHSPRLKHLDLSMNQLGDGLSDEAFRGLTYLLFLNLSRNVFNYIPSSRFDGLSSLQTLDLSRNTLIHVDRDAFQGLRNLQTLDLSQNRLSNLEQEWFQRLESLQTLTLAQNKILRLSNTVFWSLNSLKKLDLSHNSISRVGRLSFKGLGQIIKLDVSYNNISVLQEGTTQTMESLVEADFGHNPLVTFDWAFKSSPSLKGLRLDYTDHLKQLTAHSLEGLTGLKRLYLSHSALSQLHPQTFSKLSELQELHLSQTQLQSMPQNAFAPLSALESIYLRDNPWHCDCLLYWLLRWLGDHKKGHMVAPLDTQCQTPLPLHGSPILDALDHHMTCINASAVPTNQKTDFQLGSDALISCNVMGYPKPSLTWVTPRNVMLHWVNNMSLFTEHPTVHGPDGDSVDNLERLELLNNGSLKVRHVGRVDSGVYRCIATNALNNCTAQVLLTINGRFIQEIKMMSIWVGLATSVAFLLLTLVGQFVVWVMGRCGWECPCCNHIGTSKGQQLWRMLENMETYKSQQLDRLRDNYTNQAQRIKDNCMQQMEWLRESYSCQVERLRDIRDYGTLQIDKIRDNYYSQVQRVRDYSTSQIDKLRENYLFQRTRIRKFSAHQLFKLRENYKLQQQHLNKILENLNIESCKANCSRTDSIIFESPELAIEPLDLGVLPPDFSAQLQLEYVESGSQISAYYTPDDTSSEVSSCSDKIQLPWEAELLVTPSRKKRLRCLNSGRRDVGSSTTDLHLHQVIIPLRMSTELLASSGPEDYSSAIDLTEAIPPTQPVRSDISSNENCIPNSTQELDTCATQEQIQTTLDLTSVECTIGDQLSEYSDKGSQNLDHLKSIECHQTATIPTQENVNETIV